MMYHSENKSFFFLYSFQFAIVREPSSGPWKKGMGWCRTSTGRWKISDEREERLSICILEKFTLWLPDPGADGYNVFISQHRAVSTSHLALLPCVGLVPTYFAAYRLRRT